VRNPQAPQAPVSPQTSRDPEGSPSSPGAITPYGSLLPRAFFDRPALDVAPALLGRVIEHETSAGLVAVLITEVEAYAGAIDAASHAYRGRTRRNEVMFGPPGHAYVYFTYGMHFCVNLVCLAEGTAAAVLLRAGRVVEGVALARVRRGHAGVVAAAGAGAGPGNLGTAGPGAGFRDLARGPARLCQALGIDRALDGADVCDPASPLRVRPGEPVSPRVIRSGPRTGIRAAAEMPWRFWAAGDPTVSPYRAYAPRRPGPR
jgi:DNA-3-methyladenine glycosylase